MSEKTPSTPTRLCPTCGTRLSPQAERCLVCGTHLENGVKAAKPPRAVSSTRVPYVTLSLPATIGLLALFLGVGAVLVYFAMGQAAAQAVQPTDTATLTPTSTATFTPTPFTPTPTDTPLPTLTPLAYTVKLGDNCGSIAFAFNVSIQSIVLQNDLPASCTLVEGQRILIPQPTPTNTPLPTVTLNPVEQTEAACEKVEYTVQENDTLSAIAFNYNVPMAAIREYNGLVNDVVRFGQTLIIPLCQRNATPGPTPTPTLPPPYPAVNLLLPADGAAFSLADESIVLQWASVGTLRENEAYAVALEDVTSGEGRKLVSYVVDTKFIIPAEFLPVDVIPHVIRWWVVTVRQVGTDEDGNPVWEPAGAVSVARVFTWTGGALLITPTP